MGSDAAMLSADPEKRSGPNDVRSRSFSASSGLLLNRPVISGRGSIGPDSISVPGGAQSNTGSAGPPYTPTTPGGGASSAFSYVPASSHTGPGGSLNGGIVNLRNAEPSDPYFRQPRPRRVTMELPSPGGRSRGSWASGDWTKVNSPDNGGSSPDPGEGPSISGRVTPQPVPLVGARDRSDSNPDDSLRPKTDYATREVDYYYGVRGPALSHMPTRRLKTGPADPTGPVSSATGWFRNLFGGKTKEKGKGFEVVRSSRMPPHENVSNNDDAAIALQDQAPYADEPDVAKKTTSTAVRSRHLILDDEGDAVGAGTRRLPSNPPSPISSDSEPEDSDGDEFVSDEDEPSFSKGKNVRVAPLLPDIDAGGSINLPSRFNSKASAHPARLNNMSVNGEEVPAVPRKSSKRAGSFANSSDNGSRERTRLSVIPSSPTTVASPARTALAPDWPLPQRMPFGGVSPNLSGNHHRSHSNTSAISAVSALSARSDDQNILPARHNPGQSNTLSPFTPPFREDRPSSVGYVQQHRASDHIHAPGTHVLSGSTAELVDDASARTASSDGGRQSNF